MASPSITQERTGNAGHGLDGEREAVGQKAQSQ
jgi:hypothetical protein